MSQGVGYPQLSAVMECADAAHGLGGHVISDGGCSCTGDIAKAFGGGSDFVMLGGMFSGYDDTRHATCDMRHATCDMRHATCGMQYIAKAFGGAADFVMFGGMFFG